MERNRKEEKKTEFVCGSQRKMSLGHHKYEIPVENATLLTCNATVLPAQHSNHNVKFLLLGPRIASDGIYCLRSAFVSFRVHDGACTATISHRRLQEGDFNGGKEHTPCL